MQRHLLLKLLLKLLLRLLKLLVSELGDFGHYLLAHGYQRCILKDETVYHFWMIQTQTMLEILAVGC